MRKIALLFVFLVCAGPAAAKDMIAVDLAQDRVDITAGFNGARLALFGVKPERGEVAVVIQGPRHDMTVRRKESAFGAWINRSWVDFRDVPVFYDYALSASSRRLASRDILLENGIGIDSLRFETRGARDKKEQQEFRDALIRNQQARGLFPVEAKDIEKISGTFFRANFYIPANVHVGTYKVHTFYFADGVLQDSKTSTLRVAHVGSSARIFTFAYRHGFTYSLLCIALALFAGWFSNRVRKAG
ncbi:MAG: TIGR02186 family protein [Alphaproteobacteria bacterium]|nr:TIGR02186 family protein [Alphaproteobacteria bacterium]